MRTGGPLAIFTTQSPSQQLHVGGTIAFGPDGKLYVAVGDNGYPPNAQDLSNPHGKLLRINPDGSIPADNPFAGQPGKLGAIWAYGFRNPWRFQFDSATGRLFGGDVGDFSWEERNRIFHEVLIAACPSRWLKHFLSILYHQAERYRRMSLYLQPIPRDIHVEHEALLHAAMNRDADKAADILSEHIQLTFRSVQSIPVEQLNEKRHA